MHVIIDHSARNASNISEEIAMGFHESQSVLPMEEISITEGAVWKAEHGHHKTDLLFANEQFNLAPVKLALLTWLAMYTQINILRLGRFLSFLSVHVFTDT